MTSIMVILARLSAALLAASLIFSTPAMADTTYVYAAASLKTALDAIGKKWLETTGNTIVAVYGASGTLAKHIENAAPADIFISADIDWMNYLDSRNFIKTATRKNLLTNRLVVVAPQDATPVFDILKIVEALNGGKIALADVNSVPAGKYAKSALLSTGQWAAIEPHVVMQDNVRSALALVVRKEASLAIVYASDATAEPSIKILGVFDEQSHPKILYPAAITITSSSADSAAVLDYLNTPEAKSVFLANGFLNPP